MSNNSTIASSNILNYLSLNKPNLYIKWSPKHVTTKIVYDILTELNLGSIDHVESRPILNKENQQQRQQECVSFIIYMREWYRNSDADQVRLKLINNDNNFITINYEPTKYWKVYSYNPPGSNRMNNQHNARQEHNFKPSIKFNNDDYNNHMKTPANSPKMQQQKKYYKTETYVQRPHQHQQNKKYQTSQTQTKFINPAEKLKTVEVAIDDEKNEETKKSCEIETKKRNWLNDSDTDEEK